jgi:(p)ppGpp synthase/HD superfamily hydrolase
MLDKAILIAARAHQGQTDKAGQPYILHPLRVMFSRRNEIERICAVLHDVIEDTNITGYISVPEDCSEDDFSNKFIDFVENNNWTFGGTINDVKE